MVSYWIYVNTVVKRTLKDTYLQQWSEEKQKYNFITL